MFKSFFRAINYAVDLILPPVCPVTKQPVEAHGMVHRDVWERLRFIAAPMCDSCGIPLPFGEVGGKDFCLTCTDIQPDYKQARSALLYDKAAMMLVLPFKYGDATSLHKTFAPWMVQAGRDMLPLCDMLIPVPLHRHRLIRRRYNQSYLLAKAVAEKVRLPVFEDVLLRVRATPAQAQMDDKKARAKNVASAFAVRSEAAGVIADKTICLIDDVLTSGATVNECARILKLCGAKEVFVLTICRVAIS